MTVLRTLAVGLLFTILISPAFAQTININTASAQQISKTLTNVGPKKATAIVQYRSTHPAFKSLQDLQKVKGIGPKTTAENKDRIRFSGQAGNAGAGNSRTDSSQGSSSSGSSS